MGWNSVRNLLANNSRVIFAGDSFANIESSTGQRLTDQFILGVPMSDINAYESRLGNVGNTTVTRFTTSCTGATEGVNYDVVNALEGNPYSVDGGDGTNHCGLPVGGLTFKFDANLTTGASGRIVTLNIRQTDAVNIVLHSSGSAGNNFNINGDSATRLKVRPNFYVSSTATSYGAEDDKLLQLRDSVTLRSSQNLVSDTRGKKWRGDTPGSDTRIADNLSINAFGTDIPINQAPVAAGKRLMIYEATGSPSAPATGEVLNFVGCPIMVVDGSDDWIAGTYIQNLSDGSWSYSGFATDQASTGDKVFTDDQLYDWLDVTTLDFGQRMLVITYLAPEKGGTAAIKASNVAWMDRVEAWASAAGVPKPEFLNIAGHVTSGVTKPEGQACSDGVEQASETRKNASFISLHNLTDGMYFNGSDAAAESAWIEANIPSYGSFTFGSVSGADLTDPYTALLADNIHPTETGAAVFTYLVNEAIQSSSDGIRARPRRGYPTYFRSPNGVR